MVPHTYPTIEGRLVLGVITDITGLNEWQDYIPVVAQTNPVASSRNTFANDGYMGVNVLSSLTGLNAWIDYIPCYVVTGRSSPFSVSPDGYISVSAEVGTLGGASLADYIINSKTPDLVADFNGSLNTGTEFYDAGGTVDTFAELITHSRAGNATMTDGYGPELWTNPAQTLQGPWVSAGSGVYTIDGSQSGTVGVIDDDFVVIGKSYSITYTVSNRSAGGVTGQVGSVSGNTNSSDGTYTDIIVATATNKPRVNANSSFIGTVSNISVKENQIFTLEGNASVFQPPVDAKGPFGYLAEKAVTNLVTYSQDFTDSSWVKGNTATLALDSVGPDGQANSAVKLIDSNDSGTGSVIAYTNLTLATTTAHTFSCYLKADQLSWGYLRVAGYATLPNGGAYFDLSSGTVGTVEDAAYSATIQDVGNGWYRCALSFTTEADGTGRLDIFVAQDDLDPNVARDGTSSILIYGAQMEVNTFPTSYIATTGAAVTRNGDLLTVPGGIISPSEASISLEASSGHNVNGGTAHTLFSFNGAFRMYAYSASGSGYYPVNSTPMTVTGASRYNTAVRSTLTYKGDDVALYHGDASVAGNFGSTPIIVSNTPTLGAYNSGNQPGYSFRNVKIFDKELTEDQVGDL